jgi:hypothetical protein
MRPFIFPVGQCLITIEKLVGCRRHNTGSTVELLATTEALTRRHERQLPRLSSSLLKPGLFEPKQSGLSMSEVSRPPQ